MKQEAVGDKANIRRSTVLEQVLTPINPNLRARPSPENEYAEYKQRMRSSAFKRTTVDRTPLRIASPLGIDQSPSGVAGFWQKRHHDTPHVVTSASSTSTTQSPDIEPHNETICSCDTAPNSLDGWQQALCFYNAKRAKLVLQNGVEVLNTINKVQRPWQISLHENGLQLDLQPKSGRTNRFMRPSNLVKIILGDVSQVWTVHSESESDPRRICILQRKGEPIMFDVDDSNRQLQLLVCMKRLAPAAVAIFDLGQV
jgi:hypothetical protein